MSTQTIIEKEFGEQNPLDESLYGLDEEGLEGVPELVWMVGFDLFGRFGTGTSEGKK